MDALVDDEEVVTATSEASSRDKDTVSDSGSVGSGGGGGVNVCRKSVLSPVSSSVSSLRTANGTVVFTSVSSPTTSGIKHPGTQTIAVPQPGGGVSIVQLQIPNQSNVVQSVIQPNQQSVIQAAGGATTVQTVQLPKNVIFLNKLGQGSVIHSTDSAEANTHPVQLISARSDDSDTVITTIEDESKKRREVLARRPSYRKILNELSSAEAVSTISSLPSEIKQEDSEHADRGDSNTATITVASPYLKVVPASAIQLAAGSQDGTLQGLQALTMTNATGPGTSAIVQYTQNQDGQFFVPVSAADLQAYQLRTSGSGTPSGLTQGVVMTPTGNLSSQGHHVAEDAAKKRELRLLKNREAAKECRRKKKEYIKCLENRVAVLENQNKALIEELKSLKELYCQKNE